VAEANWPSALVLKARTALPLGIFYLDQNIGERMPRGSLMIAGYHVGEFRRDWHAGAFLHALWDTSDKFCFL